VRTALAGLEFVFAQVDIVQMSVLEFRDRTGRPYYHLERFIVSEGHARARARDIYLTHRSHLGRQLHQI
jgi:hypothetical protein